MNLFHEAKKVLDTDGKVNPLGPYGRQKLTGREISTYFRRNPVKDANLKKAVQVALDLGGADSIARKEIKSFYGDKILKAKEVQNALQYANESVNLGENYRTAARHGMGTEGKKEARVGLELDYYDKTGTKYMGKIVKKDSKGYTVKDDKSGKMHTFVYHDRIKARKFLQKVGIDKQEQEWIEKNDKDTHYYNNSALKNEWLSLSYPIYDGDYYFAFVNDKVRVNAQANAKANRKLRELTTSFLDAEAIYKEMYQFFQMQFKQHGSSDTMTREELWRAVLDIRKKNPAPKREVKESVMDAYKTMHETTLKEEMITYRVKGMQKPEEQKFIRSAKMMGLKITMDKGKKDTVIVMSGTKKKLRDFDAIARGKSSYGDPSTITHFDEK